MSDGKMSDLINIDPSINNDKKHIQHEIDMARSWGDIVTMYNDCFWGYMYCGWSVSFKSNQWNGLFPFAYFGWKNPAAKDFPGEWKKISAVSRGNNDQPVLDLLQNSVVP
jgi:hypothetical protein